MAVKERTTSEKEYHREYMRKWRLANPEKDKAITDRYHARHSPRIKANHRKWVSENKEHRKAYMQKWALENAAERKTYHQERHEKNPEIRKVNWANYGPKNRAGARRRAGLPDPTRPEVKHCECCGNPPSSGKKALCLDHCHKTGRFRGWLCIKCNSSIGGLGDNIEGLERAIEYLRRSKS